VRKVYETIRLYSEVEPEKVAAAMPLIARLLLGKPLDEREYWSQARRDEQHWDWVPALPRSVGPGSTVRVRLDANGQNDPRRVHNGRVGVIVGIRRDVIVSYSDNPSQGLGVGQHHELNKLERQVPVQQK
jgi:hypothetical protein